MKISFVDKILVTSMLNLYKCQAGSVYFGVLLRNDTVFAKYLNNTRISVTFFPWNIF